MILKDKILDYISQHSTGGVSDLMASLGKDHSRASVGRALNALVEAHLLEVSGRARATKYTLAGSATVHAHLSVPYNQRAMVFYNRSFLDAYVPGQTFYLRETDRARLAKIGKPAGPSMPAGTYAKRILERLLIDLSWASSRMEGNTYDLLQTERLIKYGEEVQGKARKEAVMILNHKEAINYIVENLDSVSVGRQDLLNIHALLMDGLLTDPSLAGRLRQGPVGITGSAYSPLDNPHQIKEEFEILHDKAALIRDPFEQGMFLLIHLPYLQSFADGNKRTSRIAFNIPLLKAGLVPMSFATMLDRDYVNGLLGVYELNNVSLLREAFLTAYEASSVNYRVLREEVDDPAKAALTYRELVRKAVRACVLEWKSFDKKKVVEMIAEHAVPEDDRDDLLDYIRTEFAALHEGNVIRYRLRASDIPRS